MQWFCDPKISFSYQLIIQTEKVEENDGVLVKPCLRKNKLERKKNKEKRINLNSGVNYCNEKKEKNN